MEGTIESQENKVTIGPNGRVQAGIRAREVVILGQVQGNVEATDKVDIRKDAKLVGDITTSRISIEDGALFKGSIDIKKSEPKTAAASAPAPAPGALRAGRAGIGSRRRERVGASRGRSARAKSCSPVDNVTGETTFHLPQGK